MGSLGVCQGSVVGPSGVRWRFCLRASGASFVMALSGVFQGSSRGLLGRGSLGVHWGSVGGPMGVSRN